MKRFMIAAAVLLATASPASSEPMLPWESIQKDDQATARRLGNVLARKPNSKDGLAELDRLLVTAPQRTGIAGLIQYFRAGCLMHLNRHPEALEAINQAIALLPGYSAPHLLASQLHTYSDRPGEAVDQLLAATAIDRDIAEQLDDYAVASLISRLDEQGQQDKLLAISERLIDTGWNKGSPSTRSRMAMAVIEQRLSGGTLDRAAAMLPHVARPGDAYKIMTEERFAPLRPAAREAAGARLERLWVTFLEAEKTRWEQSGDEEDGLAYARALLRADRNAELIETFLPFVRKNMSNPDAAFLLANIGDAMAREGKWDELDALFAEAAAAWPLGSRANALNVAANRGRLLVIQGRHAEGLAQLDAAIADASAWGGEVNSGALGALHSYRACALTQLGRLQEAAGSIAFVANRRRVEVGDYVDLLLCMGDMDAARAALIEGLAQEPTRAEVVAWVQPAEVRLPSEFARSVDARADRLKQDPALRHAVSHHGSILDWSRNAGAPKRGG